MEDGTHAAARIMLGCWTVFPKKGAPV